MRKCCAFCDNELEFDIDDGYKNYPYVLAIRYNDDSGTRMYFCSKECKKRWKNYKEEIDCNYEDYDND